MAAFARVTLETPSADVPLTTKIMHQARIPNGVPVQGDFAVATVPLPATKENYVRVKAAVRALWVRL